MAVSRQIDFLLSGLIDTNGLPLSGGKVTCYEAGTTTLKTTWTDQAKTTPSSNPITLNSLGQATIFGDGNYKFKIERSDNTLVTTIDNIVINEQQSINTIYAASGTSTAYTVTPSPIPTSISDGYTINFTVNGTCGESPTLNIAGLGAINLIRPVGGNVRALSMILGKVYTATKTSAGLVVSNLSTPFTDWAPTLTGWSVAPTNTLYQYMINSGGNMCTVLVRQATPGTSNATSVSLTAPLAARTATNSLWIADAAVSNNGAAQATPAVAYILSASSTIVVDRDYASATWSNINGKSVNFVLQYGI